MTHRALLALPLALMACVEPVIPPEDPLDACGASGLQGLVGKDKSVLAAMTFSAGTRILEPGQAMTMDYGAARLNIFFDAAGRIEKVSCG